MDKGYNSYIPMDEWTKTWVTRLNKGARWHLGTYIDPLKFLTNPEKAIIGYNNEVRSDQLLLFKT